MTRSKAACAHKIIEVLKAEFMGIAETHLAPEPTTEPKGNAHAIRSTGIDDVSMDRLLSGIGEDAGKLIRDKVLLLPPLDLTGLSPEEAAQAGPSWRARLKYAGLTDQELQKHGFLMENGSLNVASVLEENSMYRPSRTPGK